MKVTARYQVQIGAVPIDVHIVRGFAAKTGDDGRYIPQKNLIVLDDDLKGSQLLATFIHEARHAYQQKFGLYEILDDQAQEMDCSTTAEFVLSLIPVLNQLASPKR